MDGMNTGTTSTYVCDVQCGLPIVGASAPTTSLTAVGAQNLSRVVILRAYKKRRGEATPKLGGDD